MSVDLLIKTSAPIRPRELVERAAAVCSQLLGIEKIPSISWSPYGNGDPSGAPNTGLLSEDGDMIEFQVEPPAGVAFASVLESLAYSGTVLVITPGRTPLGAALGAALAVACAEMEQSLIRDPSLHYTAFAELPPCRFLELLSMPWTSKSMDEASLMFQNSLHAHLPAP